MHAKNCPWRKALSRKRHTLNPFGPYAYLWGSHEIDVTPGTEKSTACGSGQPACSAKALAKDPRQQSEWHPIPRDCASAAISGMGSKLP